MTIVSDHLAPSNYLAPGDYKRTIYQGTFEDGDSRWTLTDAEVVDDEAHTGTKSLKLTAGGSASQIDQISSGVVSFWIKTDGATTVNVIFSTVTWELIISEAIDWTQYFFSVTTTGVALENTGANNIWIDDIEPSEELELELDIGSLTISETTVGSIVLDTIMVGSLTLTESQYGSITLTISEE